MKTFKKITVMIIAAVILAAFASTFYAANMPNQPAEPPVSVSDAQATDTANAGENGLLIAPGPKDGSAVGNASGTDAGTNETSKLHEKANVMDTLLIMGQGMLGIFIVMLLILLLIIILNAATKKKAE